MAPEDWIDGRVGDLIQGLESGVSVNGEDRALKNAEKGVLKVSAVSYGYFDPSAVKAITSSTELERAKTVPQKGQIIISRSNTEALVGASAYIAEDYFDLFLPDKLWQTVPKQNTDMKWLSYILASDHSRYVLSNLSTGTSGSMKNITKGELLGLKIAIPPLPEQRKIAKILGTWDKAIATTENLIEASKQQKKALMQQLLTGKKRFAGFEGEWEEIPLGKISESVTSGSRDWAKYYSNSGSKFIRMTNLPRDNINLKLDDLKFVDVQCGSSDGRRTSLQYGDILISITAELGKIGWVPDDLGEAYINQHVALVRIRHELSYSKFIAFQLSSKAMNYRINRLNDSGAKAGLNLSTIRSIYIKIPEIAEQKKVSTVLVAADLEIKKHQTKLTHLKQEKKALMQQLLTGKRRVKVEPKEAA
ncbi:restriction endonuclease subunit S [Parendozoicomonas sp. Alg238-R29]|uniref:restriction endonuclease subunit S n=1 Tax=Parendozoicomonas sp. Alg238-R29 TaxID=2993446 RepID=UPI00248DD844|nr:restriction endonuclease subunit S [Parendozoicomonas sp. Alg238-R29]